MNINDFISYAPQIVPELLNNYCIVNRNLMNLREIENMEYDDFAYNARVRVPLKLYKYFSNKGNKTNDGKILNYSFDALKNNTVFMQSPNNFDDVYDSGINIDIQEFHKYSLIELSKRCDIKVNTNGTIEEIGNEFIKYIIQSFNLHKNFDHIFTEKTDSELKEKSNDFFKAKLTSEFDKNQDLGKIIPKIINEEYEKYLNDLKNTFNVSCFTTNPFSQLMWSGYADCHKGFCVEYTVLPSDDNYKKIFYNLFPMIYCKTRTNITEKFVISKDDFTKESLRDILVHGVLRKSIDWGYQDEWRLILPLNEKEAHTVKFFPITKVFLGNRMPSNERRKIIEFCNLNNIQYVGVRRKSNIFEMEECPIKCEKCPNYLNTIKG